MIRSLKILVLLAGPLSLFAQQPEKPVRIQSRDQPALFGPLQFREDSVTIIGEYKNFRSGPPFKVAGMDWLSNREVTYSTPIDSNGRFTLTFPMPAAGELFIDFGRTNLWNIGIPGETILLSADMNTLSPPLRKDTVAAAAWLEHGSLRIAGTHARLHKDLYDYWRHQTTIQLPQYNTRAWFERFNLSEYCDTITNILRYRIQFIQDYHRKKPMSPQALQFLETLIRYHMASSLTQRYHYALWNDREKYERKYFATIDSIVRPAITTGYLTIDYRTTLRDIRSHSGTKALNLKLTNIDSLQNEYILHPVEKVLTHTWAASRQMSQGHVLSDSMLAALGAQVKDPYLRQQLTKQNDILKAMQADNELLAGTRFVTAFPELKTSAEIFKYITAPYRGKVIYLDIWGTWCVPCRDAMQYMPPIKQQFADKDVVFLYLANRSPGDPWKNAIKQLKITGANVIHYNLPAGMQDVFEKEYLDGGFPTYLLIDKAGNLVTKKAPRPQEPAALMEAINKLL